jgi:hypothetical protein
VKALIALLALVLLIVPMLAGIRRMRKLPPATGGKDDQASSR